VQAPTPRQVEPVVAPPPGNPRFPLVDSLRAIAALAVLVTHTAFLSGANAFGVYGAYTARLDVGVTIFFVISGFLLYRPFVAARIDGRDPPRVRDYARRRALRIFPAYWLALTVLSIWPGLVGMFTDHSWAYYLLLQNYFQTWIIGGIGATWSLCIELSFYVLLPVLAWVALRTLPSRTREQRIRSEFAMLAILGVGSVLLRALTTNTRWNTTLPGNFDWFVLGMLLAAGSAALAGRPEPAAVRFLRRYPFAAWVPALVAFWAVSTQLNLEHGLRLPQLTTGQNIGQHLLYGAVAVFLMLPAVFADDGGGVTRAVLRNRVLAWLGLVSYGIFLWHQPLAVQVWKAHDYGVLPQARMAYITIGTFVLALICATLSYYLLERPILRYKDRPFRRRRRSQPAAGVSEASGTAG
jgi:peptidoglycan/LPS O-acetylase OafA/YrhL